MVISYTNSEGGLLVKLPSHWRLELQENPERMEDPSLTLVLPKDDTENEYFNIRNAGDYPNLPSGISILVLRYIMKYISMNINDPNIRSIDIDSLERKAFAEIRSDFDNLSEYL